MDIIEKEVVKEVPAGYWHNAYGCGYPYGSYGYGCGNTWGTSTVFNPSQLPASRGVAGAGLGLN